MSLAFNCRAGRQKSVTLGQEGGGSREVNREKRAQRMHEMYVAERAETTDINKHACLGR